DFRVTGIFAPLPRHPIPSRLRLVAMSPGLLDDTSSLIGNSCAAADGRMPFRVVQALEIFDISFLIDRDSPGDADVADVAVLVDAARHAGENADVVLPDEGRERARQLVAL